jgi:hypothetical protein
MAKQDVVVEANETPNAIVMEAAFEVAQPDSIRIKVTAEIQVSVEYLKNIEENTKVIRTAIDGAAFELDGHILSVDIA